MTVLWSINMSKNTLEFKKYANLSNTQSNVSNNELSTQLKKEQDVFLNAVNKLEENEQDRELTKAIIAIGKKLNLVVIAEGVETLEQDAFIRYEECDLGQGYLYGKPITAQEFEQEFIHKKEH